ncbi:MAG: ctpA [Candidatus Kaiserbacteria bacterium]|nr:ctpA [Candidatus Kaiserbacteria bacterium]
MRPNSISTTAASIGGAVLILISFAGGLELGTHRAVAASASGAPAGVDFSPVWKSWDLLNKNFVPAAVATSSPIATTTAALNQQKVYGMITGLAASLNDPYTFFFPPTENKQFSSDMSGVFEGVGMEIDVKDQTLVVVTPLKGSPAEAAGIKAGDQVLKINGQETTGMDVTAAVKIIRGPKGSVVTLTMMRSGWTAPKEIKVTRQVINVPIVVTTKRPDGVFVISVSTFTSNAPDLFRDALREFIQSGDTKLVLDLRGNPGGYLDAAVDIASWFLPSGAIVVTEDYAGHQTNIIHRSSGYNVFNSNLKMVILVNKGSASASEILTDALRYYKVGVSVGTNTFGKGVVQELFDVTPETSIKITVARWLGPDGFQIPHAGLTPDVQQDVTDEDIKAGKDPQMARAVQILTGVAPVSATSTATSTHQ